MQKFCIGVIGSTPLAHKPAKGANRVTPPSWPQKKYLVIIVSEVSSKQYLRKEKYLKFFLNVDFFHIIKTQKCDKNIKIGQYISVVDSDMFLGLLDLDLDQLVRGIIKQK